MAVQNEYNPGRYSSSYFEDHADEDDEEDSHFIISLEDNGEEDGLLIDFDESDGTGHQHDLSSVPASDQSTMYFHQTENSCSVPKTVSPSVQPLHQNPDRTNEHITTLPLSFSASKQTVTSFPSYDPAISSKSVHHDDPLPSTFLYSTETSPSLLSNLKHSTDLSSTDAWRMPDIPGTCLSENRNPPFDSFQKGETERYTSGVFGLTGSTLAYPDMSDTNSKNHPYSDMSRACLETVRLDNENSGIWSEAIFLSRTSGVSDSSISNRTGNSNVLPVSISSKNDFTSSAFQDPSSRQDANYTMQTASGTLTTHFTKAYEVSYQSSSVTPGTSHNGAFPKVTSNDAGMRGWNLFSEVPQDFTNAAGNVMPESLLSGCTCIMCYKGPGFKDSYLEPTFDLPSTEQKALTALKIPVKRKRAGTFLPLVKKIKAAVPNMHVSDSRCLPRISYVEPIHISHQQVQSHLASNDNETVLHTNVDCSSSFKHSQIATDQNLNGKETVKNVQLPTVLFEDPKDNNFLSKSSVSNISGTTGPPYISVNSLNAPQKDISTVTVSTKSQSIVHLPSKVVSAPTAKSVLAVPTYKVAPTKVFLKPPSTQLQNGSHHTDSVALPIISQASSFICPPLTHKTQKSRPPRIVSSSIPASVKVTSSSTNSTVNLQDYKIVYKASDKVLLLYKPMMLDQPKVVSSDQQSKGKHKVGKTEEQPTALVKVPTVICDGQNTKSQVTQKSGKIQNGIEDMPANSQPTSGVSIDNPNGLKYLLKNAEKIDLSSPGQVMIRLKPQTSPKSPSLSPQVSPRGKNATQPVRPTVLNSPPKNSKYTTSLLKDSKNKVEGHVKSPDNSTHPSHSAVLSENGPLVMPSQNVPAEKPIVDPSPSSVTQTLLHLINSHFHDQTVNEKSLINFIRGAEGTVSLISKVNHSEGTNEPGKPSDTQGNVAVHSSDQLLNTCMSKKVLPCSSKLDAPQPRLPQEGLPSTYVEDWVNQAKSFRSANIDEEYSFNSNSLQNIDQSTSGEHSVNHFKAASLSPRDRATNGFKNLAKTDLLKSRNDNMQETLQEQSESDTYNNSRGQNNPEDHYSSSKDKRLTNISKVNSATKISSILTKTPLKRSTSCFASRRGHSSSVVTCSKGIKLKIRLNELKRVKAKKKRTLDPLVSKINSTSDKPVAPVEQEKMQALCSSPITNNTGKICNEAKLSEVKEKIETAEEMFQRFQDQAMQEVFKAQLGVGYLSRSLRPTRTQASLMGKISCQADTMEPQKKLAEEETNPPHDINKGNKVEKTEAFKNTGAKNSVEANKKRLSEGNAQPIKVKRPKLSIRDYPKLKEDTSIAYEKKLFCSHILAAHQVHVRFNTFENTSSGRSFLVPFFNLGGTRTQFDVEDIDYINQAVMDFEKEDRTCARHLLFYSRSGKKATFLRKETSFQSNLIKDNSYKKCSFILEGFKREASKETVPPPEQWKVDDKVDIEIDTADVDNDIEIGFEPCEIESNQECINHLNALDAKRVEEGDRFCEDGLVQNEVNKTVHTVVSSDSVNSFTANQMATSSNAESSCVKKRPNILKRNIVLSVKQGVIGPDVKFQAHSKTGSSLKNAQMDEHDSHITTLSREPEDSLAYTEKLKALILSRTLQEGTKDNHEQDLHGANISGIKSKEQSDNSCVYFDNVADETPSFLLQQAIKTEKPDDGYEEACCHYKSNTVGSISRDTHVEPLTSLEQNDSDFSRFVMKEEPVDDYFTPQTQPTTEVQPDICGAVSPGVNQMSPGANGCELEAPKASLGKGSVDIETLQQKSAQHDLSLDDTEANVANIYPQVKGGGFLSAVDERPGNSTSPTAAVSDTEHPMSNSISSTATASEIEYPMSDSPLPSSSVSESSEVPPSSDDGSEDSGEDDDSSTSTSITLTQQPASDLMAAPSGDDSRNNSGQSKITSLVESLRQRLSEQVTSLPSWMADKSELVEETKKKRKKKTKKKIHLSEEDILVETKGQCNSLEAVCSVGSVVVSSTSSSATEILSQTHTVSLSSNSISGLSPAAVRSIPMHGTSLVPSPAAPTTVPPSVDPNGTVTLSSELKTSPSPNITLPGYRDISSKSSMLLPIIKPTEEKSESNHTEQVNHHSAISSPSSKDSFIVNTFQKLPLINASPVESVENVKPFVFSLRDSDKDASNHNFSLLPAEEPESLEKPRSNGNKEAVAIQQTGTDTEEPLNSHRSTPTDFEIDVGLDDLPETSLTFQAILPQSNFDSDPSGDSINRKNLEMNSEDLDCRVTQNQHAGNSFMNKKQKSRSRSRAKKEPHERLKPSSKEEAQNGSVASYLCKKFALNNEGSQMSHIVKGPRLLHMRRHRNIASSPVKPTKTIQPQPEQIPVKPTLVATEPISTAELSKVPTLSEIFGVSIKTEKQQNTTGVENEIPPVVTRGLGSKENTSQVARKRTSQRGKVSSTGTTESKKVTDTPKNQVPENEENGSLPSSFEKTEICNTVSKPQRKQTRAQTKPGRKGVNDGQLLTYDLKPCRVLLERLNSNTIKKAQQGINVIKIKEEPMEQEQEPVNDEQHEGVNSDATSASSKQVTKRVVKKKKRKSTKMSRRAAPRAKQDIVDYYTSVLEALQKKAQLLEEESKRKEDEKKFKEETEEQLKVERVKDEDKNMNMASVERNKEEIDEKKMGQEKEGDRKELEMGSEGVDVKSVVETGEGKKESGSLDAEVVGSSSNTNEEKRVEQTSEKPCKDQVEADTSSKEQAISNSAVGSITHVGEEEKQVCDKTTFDSQVQPSLQITAIGESLHSQADVTASLAIDLSPEKCFEKKDVVLCLKEDELDQFCEGDLLSETEETEASLLEHIGGFEEDMGTVPQEEVEKLLGLDSSDNTTFSNIRSDSGVEDGVVKEISEGINFPRDDVVPEQISFTKDETRVQNCDDEAPRDEIVSSSYDRNLLTSPENLSLPPADSDETKISENSEAENSCQSHPAIQHSSLATGQNFKFKFKLPTGLLTKAIKMSKELKNVFGESVTEEIPLPQEKKLVPSDGIVNSSEGDTSLQKGLQQQVPCGSGDITPATQNLDKESSKVDQPHIPKFKLKLGPQAISAIQTAKTQFLQKKKERKVEGKTKTSNQSDTSDLQFQQDIEFYLRSSEKKPEESSSVSQNMEDDQAGSNVEAKPQSNQMQEMLERKRRIVVPQRELRVTRSSKESMKIICEKQNMDGKPSATSDSCAEEENSLMKESNVETDSENQKDEGIFSQVKIFKTSKNESASNGSIQESQTSETNQPETKTREMSLLKSKAIDISKLKMKLNPLLASRLVSSQAAGRRGGATQVTSSKSNEFFSVEGNGVSSTGIQHIPETLHIQVAVIEKEQKDPSKIVSAISNDNVEKRTQSEDNSKVLSHSVKDSQEVKTLPLLNTTKLCSILKNFQSKVNSNKNSNVTGKTQELASPANAVSTRITRNRNKLAVNQDNKTPLKANLKRDKMTKSVEAGDRRVGRKLKRKAAVSSGCSVGLPEESKVKKEEEVPSVGKVEADDKGERSFFDCLSNIASDVWEQQ